MTTLLWVLLGAWVAAHVGFFAAEALCQVAARGGAALAASEGQP